MKPFFPTSKLKDIEARVQALAPVQSRTREEVAQAIKGAGRIIGAVRSFPGCKKAIISAIKASSSVGVWGLAADIVEALSDFPEAREEIKMVLLAKQNVTEKGLPLAVSE
jgi:hypothetical protein